MRVALASAAVALLCACASSSRPGATVPVARSTNPCSYVSASDVATAVGGPVNDGRSGSTSPWNDAASCVFTPRGTFAVAMPGSNAEFHFASIAFLDEPTFERLIAPPTPFSAVHQVSGYGDQAFEVGAPHYEILFVRRGAYRAGFEVAAGLGSFFGPEERLASIVVPRLPA
jgi:hypothetical protein